MADQVTAIADIIDPEVLADQISAKFPDNLVVGRSNLVQVDTTFPLGSPGTWFEIPFWKRIAEFDEISEGVEIPVNKLTAGREQTQVLRGGAAYEVYDTAKLVSIADPMGEISGQVGRRAAEYIDGKLVAALDVTPNVYDISGVSAGTMDQNTPITAMISTLGDNYQKLLGQGVFIMHSKPYGDLLKLGVIQNQYQSGMDTIRTGVIPTIAGLPILVSDRVTATTVSSVTKYNSYIVGPGALGLFFQRNVKVEFDRIVRLQADLIVATVHFAAHLYGWDEKTSALAYEDAKSLHAIKIVSK